MTEDFSGEPIQKALESASPDLRLEAALRAIERGDRQLLPFLLERLDRETDGRVLAALVRAIGTLGQAVHLPRVQRFLNVTDDPQLVADTIEAICALDPDVGFTLITPLLQSGDSQVRANAVHALYHREKQAALQTLGRMMSSSQKSVRLAAVRCLIRLGDEDCQRLLVRMLVVEEDVEIQERIFDHLEKSGQAFLVEELRGIRGRGFHDVARLEGLIGSLTERHALPTEPPVSRALPAIAGDPSVAPAAPAPRNAPRSTARSRRLQTGIPQPRPFLMTLTQDWRISAGAVLVFAVGIGWQLLHHETELDPANLAVTETTVQDVATSTTPHQHLEQRVRWSGEVEKVDGPNHTVRFRQAGQVVSATLPGPLSHEIKPGSQVEVTGRIMGRGRLGAIYVLAHAIQPR